MRLEGGISLDENLLKLFLDSINPKFVSKLKKEEYVFKVKRRNITSGNKLLQGQRMDSAYGAFVSALDSCSGLCVTGDSSEIIVATSVIDGNVIFDFGILLHEMGHGFDQRVASFEVGGAVQPFHSSSGANRKGLDMAAAFAAEAGGFKYKYFSTQPGEFFAEVFSRYCLDRARTMKTFPKSVLVLDKVLKDFDILQNPETENMVDAVKLNEALETMLLHPNITTTPDLWEVVKKEERHNSMKTKQQGDWARDAYVVGLVTDDVTSARVLSKDLSRRLFHSRVHDTSAYSVDDAWLEVDMSTAVQDDGTPTGNGLKTTVFDCRFDHHAFVVMSPAEGITASSKGSYGLADFVSFANKGNDLCVLVLYGSTDNLKHVSKLLSRPGHRVNYVQCVVATVTAEQVTNQLLREASVEGKYFSEQAKTMLLSEATNEGTTLSDIGRLWSEIRRFQQKRVKDAYADSSNIFSDEANFYILTLDLSSAIESIKGNQIDHELALKEMIGITDVKKMIGGIVKGLRLRSVTKMDSKLPRLNLLFLGNPGTGIYRRAFILYVCLIE